MINNSGTLIDGNVLQSLRNGKAALTTLNGQQVIIRAPTEAGKCTTLLLFIVFRIVF